ncbi:hypothetical protein AWB91_09720 [Mycobacterium paraense]|uniref:Twin-arginine translocation pathway signal n=1 Tax=Mycobacterium paraense TaxID=767916 RepID=A0ABX3VTD8_9MYCO|nr:hypothetical protein [Mycobacterium paraense]ORW32757.1 hypothetical protein AWB91_09720 [Mycobacterium paraense]ORW44983.1 hypothetical protein AWB88_04795 [Mycobacterium paraense]
MSSTVDMEEISVAQDDASADLLAEEAEEVPSPGDRPKRRRFRVRWRPLLIHSVLPAAALALALGSGYLKWQDSSMRADRAAAAQSVAAATDSTIALLSYRPDSVDKDLTAARDLLTGTFRDSYTSFTRDVVIPGAKQKSIAAIATVPAAGSVSATEKRAVVLVFVDQTVTVGNDPPTESASTVRVALEKVGDRWLISDFTPI